MAEKNLILKLKLETDTSSGEKITKLIQSQRVNITATIAENEKLKQAELARAQAVQAAEKARISLLNANGITIKSLNVDLINQIARQKQLATELQVKIDKANIDIEKQGKGWGLIAGRMAAVVAQYNSIEKVSNAAIQARVMDKLLLESDLQKRLITQREQFNALIKARPLTQLAAIETTLNKEIELNNKLTRALLEQAKARTSNSLGSLGLSSAAKPTENRGYVANAAGTVAENRATKLDAEIKEAKRLYDIRVAAFNTSMAQQEIRMRQSVDIEVAARTSGINSIQAIRARAAQQEFQLEERYQAQLASIRRSVASGATPISAGNAAMTAATTAHTQALATNRIQLNQQEAALNAAANAHQNLFLRVGEAIGAYRIWNTVINAVTSSMRAVPKIGIEMESTIASLTATTGTAAGMASVMGALENEANRTGIAIGTLRETFRGFQASTSLAGETMDSTWKMFTNLNTVITGLHLPADKASGIFLAMAQIFNKTKVQSEELVKQLGNLLPGAFASFAMANNAAFGGQFKNSMDLINQMKKGLVFAHETVERFTEFMAKRFEPAFALASHGLNASIGRMDSSFTLLGESIYRSTSGPLMGIVKGLTSLAVYMKGAVEGTNNFGNVVKGVFVAIGALAVGAVYKLIASLTAQTATFITSTGAISAETAAKIRAITVNYAFMSSLAGITVSARAATAATGAMTFAVQAGSAAMGVARAAMAFLFSPAAIITGIAAIALTFFTLKDSARAAANAADEFLKQTKENLNSVAEKPLTLEMRIDADPEVVRVKKVIKDLQDSINETKTGFILTSFFNRSELNKDENKLKQLETTLKLLQEKASIELTIETGGALKDIAEVAEHFKMLALKAKGFTEEAAKMQFDLTNGAKIAELQGTVTRGLKDEAKYRADIERLKHLDEMRANKTAAPVSNTVYEKATAAALTATSALATLATAQEGLADMEAARYIEGRDLREKQDNIFAKNHLKIIEDSANKYVSLEEAVASKRAEIQQSSLEKLRVIKLQEDQLNARVGTIPQGAPYLPISQEDIIPKLQALAKDRVLVVKGEQVQIDQINREWHANQRQEELKLQTLLVDSDKAANDGKASRAQAVNEARLSAKKTYETNSTAVDNEVANINAKLEKDRTANELAFVQNAEQTKAKFKEGIRIAEKNAGDAWDKSAKSGRTAANKELKESYKDSERDIKFSIEVTKLALDDLSVAYADNSISIAEYYKKKEELQLKNIANEKAIKEGELATATKGGDKAAMAKLQDEIKILDITAQRIHPIITREQNKDVKDYTDNLKQTNIDYLNLTNNTVAATKAQEELNTAQERQKLETQIKAGGSDAKVAQSALDQLNANKENTLLQANFDQAKKYRDALNSIEQAYTSMGATSSDVLSASLGGFSPLFNLFDNFQVKQQEQLASMKELQAEAELIANRKITAGDTEGAAQKAKDAEVNAKQVQLLDKQTAQNKIKTTREAFAIGESLLKQGSKAQQVAHVASMAYNVAEKFGLLGTLAVKGASAVLEQGKGDPYTAFARMAAMAALVASVISAVGGAGGAAPKVTSSAAPVTTGTGTVLGDATAESASLENALSLLTDINYKSYRELRKINDSLSNVMASIYNIALKNATNSMLVPDSGIPSVQALVNPTQLNSIEGLKKGILQQFNSMKSLGDIFSLKNLMPSFGNLTQMFKNLATLPQDLMKMVTKLVSKIPLVGGILAKFDIASKLDPLTGLFIKGIFGTVKRTIVDGGIQTMKQQAYTLLAGMNLSMAQYTTIEEVKKSWFKKSSKTFDVLSEASKEAVTSFTTMYRSIGTAVVNLAEGLSKAAVDAAYLYKFPPIKVSLRGQATDKIIAKMKAVISKQLDLMATKVFGDTFGGLQQLGEGMFQTVNRLYAERIIAKKSFESIGAAFPQGIEDGVKLADALVQVSSNADTAAGKLKDFAQQEADFFKNFASTITQNNLIVNDFIGSLKDIFTSGLSIDQVNATKTYVNSISTSVVALNTAQKNYDLSLIKSKALIKAETAYANKPTIANKAKLDVLEVPYQTKVAETTTALAIATAQHNTAQQVSLGSFESLQQIFVRTVRTTGSFSQAIFAMRRNLDLSTEAGIKTSNMITQLDGAFTKLVDDIIKPITDQITSIADSIDTRTKETLLSQLEASRDYTTQKTLTTKIQKLITDKYNTEKTSITTIKNAFITLAQTVKDLLLGDLSTFNPFEKFQEAQKQYTDLLTLSQSNDVTIAADAASKLGAAAQKYLGEAKSYYGSTATYADIFNQVVATLTAMSTSNITQGTNAADMINALGAAAIVELQGLATTTTNAILATLEAGIVKLDISETTRSASDELATLASSAVSLGTTFEALIVKFNTVMGTVPEGQTSNMQTLTAKLAQAIASKDTKGATAIKAQISSYAKGFNKGGVPLAELYATNRTTLQTNAAKIAENQLKIKDKTLSAAAKKILQDEITALRASTSNITKIGAFADGGIASGLSLVGERGPELIQLPNSTRVINNTSTNRILADSNKETLNVLTDMKKELIILNNRMEVIERKTRLSKSTMSMA